MTCGFRGATNWSLIMKKRHHKITNSNISLGDLILTVSSVSKSNRETVAAVTDLLDSGRVRIQSHGRKLRAHVY